MLHAGLDLSRRKIDVCLLSAGGEVVEEFASPPDGDGLGGLARRVGSHGLAVRGVIESNGAAAAPATERALATGPGLWDESAPDSGTETRPPRRSTLALDERRATRAARPASCAMRSSAGGDFVVAFRTLRLPRAMRQRRALR
jgi:hypothetical protein